MRAYLEELDLPRHDVHLDLTRVRSLSVDVLTRMSDEELAVRLGVPPEAAPLARGAHDLVEAGALVRGVLEPPSANLAQSPETLERFVELRAAMPELLDRDGAKALQRELKAVGGSLRDLRLALTGAAARAGALGGAARAAAGRSRAARSTLEAMRLYDTLTRSTVELPAAPGPVRMYFCGPTVYARAHVGNARPFVVGMWLRSWLRATGYEATLVHNITDINDRIYDAAPGASAELAARATEWYLEDTRDLGLGMPDFLPKATESVPAIVHLIEELIDGGHAYAVQGDVYFRVSSFPEYGRLSGQRPDQVEEQEPNPLKEDGRDFALWKANKPETEDTWWESPWGRGRPGWHIECSAMVEEIYGPAFEIHGGGLDLVFPHHENEIAQSRSVGHPFASIWTHNGLLRFTGEKMSKSLGNVMTLREAIDEWGRETLLVFFLTASWRKPIDFSETTMQQAAARRDTLRNAFTRPGADHDESGWPAFAGALEDDFDTPAALAVLHDWASGGQLELLRRGLGVFGLESLAERAEAPPDIVALAARRAEARATRDFETSDRLRDELAALGWEMRDRDDGFDLVPA